MYAADTQFSDLEAELEKARIELKDVNQSIRKIVGRPLAAPDR